MPATITLVRRSCTKIIGCIIKLFTTTIMRIFKQIKLTNKRNAENVPNCPFHKKKRLLLNKLDHTKFTKVNGNYNLCANEATITTTKEAAKQCNFERNYPAALGFLLTSLVI